MGAQQTERVALLSIKPDYAEAIFAGRKVVEFRRSRLAPDIQAAIVYATQPVGEVIGWFRVGEIAESTPDGLWRRFRNDGAINKSDYFDYFEGASRAYAIEILEPIKLVHRLSLESLSPGLRAPQSFQYLAAPIATEVFQSQRDDARPRKPPALRPRFA